jgi:hypothetical protein
MAKDDKAKRRIGDLQDELKAKDRRIAELRDEIDGQRALVTRLREHIEDNDNAFEQFIEAFGLVQGEDGKWTNAASIAEHDKLVDQWNELVREWNAYLPIINGAPRNVGRPLAASEAQRAEVLRLHKAGRSLRGICDDTSLGLQTVRTVVAQGNGTDRTTRKHRQRFERIEIDRMAMARQKRQRRDRKAMPRRINAVLEEGRELVKEAKGLGKT